MTGSPNPIPDLLSKLSKRKKKRSSDKREVTQGSGENMRTQEATVGSNEKIEGPSSNPTVPRKSKQRQQHSGEKTLDESSVPKKKSGTKKKVGSKEKDQSTEFEPVHAAQRPAVSKNKKRSNIFANEDQKDAVSVPRQTGSAPPTSNPERLKDRFKDILKKKHDDDQPTIFQKTKAEQRPAKARMKSHKSGRSREKEKDKKHHHHHHHGKHHTSPPIITNQPPPTTSPTPKDATPAAVVNQDDDEQAPTRFEQVHANVRPAVVIEKPRKASRRSSRRQDGRKPPSVQQEETSDYEEAPVGEADPTVPSEAEPDKSKLVPVPAVPEKREEEKPQQYDPSETIEEDFPENPAYAFEIWKAKSKIANKPKPVETQIPKPSQPPCNDGKPDTTNNNNKNNDDDNAPRSDYIIKY